MTSMPQMTGSLLDRLTASGRTVLCLGLVFILLCEVWLLRDVLEKKKQLAIESEMAVPACGWMRMRVEDWQAEDIEFWFLSDISQAVGPIERRRAGMGYVSVREPVLRQSEEESRDPAATDIRIPLLDDVAQIGPVGYQSSFRGEALTQQGYPVRWLNKGWYADKEQVMEMRGKCQGEKFYPYATWASGLGYKGPILQHLDAVRQSVRVWKVPAYLLLAVMQVESGGRTMLVSPRDAVGLMQVVPDGAGKAVAKHLGEDEKEPDLFAPDINIFYGACYLHLLNKKYFSGVTDPDARTLCVLTAYNIGPGRFLRLFSGEKRSGITLINTFSPRGLYEEIKERVHPGGSYTYLDKVITLMRQYKSMGY